MKTQTFNEIPAKTAGLWKFCLIFNEIFHKRRIILKWSIQFWVNFSVWVSRIDFILHILLILDSINNLAMQPLMLDQSKITKKAFLNDSKRFLATSDQLDIAYSDSSKHSSRLSNGITHGLHMDHSMITIQWYKILSFSFFLLWVDFGGNLSQGAAPLIAWYEI